MGGEVKACIFDIQPYSIHDGPGIRTTVFFKGCPLRCLWCHNPESNEHYPQLMYYSAKCTGCGRCVSVCPKEAIALVSEKVKTDRDICDDCGLCADICLYEAREISGSMMTVSEVFEKAVQDKEFFDASGGGITLSGGEPLGQSDFVRLLLKKCKENGIHTSIETCGYAQKTKVLEALKDVDLVLYDLKVMEPQLHQKLTGARNDIILSNAIAIRKKLKKEMVIRIPIIPGLNDSRQNIEETAKFIADKLGTEVPVHLLTYHALGDAKLDSLESQKKRLNIQPPEDEHMEQLKDWVTAYKLKVQIGGNM